MIATMANTGYKVPVLGDSGVTLASFVATAGAKALKAVRCGPDVFDPDSFVSEDPLRRLREAVRRGCARRGDWRGVGLRRGDASRSALKADRGKGGAPLAAALQNVSGSGIPSRADGKRRTDAVLQCDEPRFSVSAASDKLYHVTGRAG